MKYATHKKRVARDARLRRLVGTARWPKNYSGIVDDVIRRDVQRVIEEFAQIKRAHKSKPSSLPEPPSDRVYLSNVRSVYTLKKATMGKFNRTAVPLVCYYHDDDAKKAIVLGEVVYSAEKTRTRRFVILAHLRCALRKGVVWPEDLPPRFASLLTP